MELILIRLMSDGSGHGGRLGKYEVRRSTSVPYVVHGSHWVRRTSYTVVRAALYCCSVLHCIV